MISHKDLPEKNKFQVRPFRMSSARDEWKPLNFNDVLA